ncbi:MAG: DnaJ domain-containing protein [Dehalococcoidia bacterium]|nr:DnaJ domain-containing protein [Dehalococcoidia bacterium]
MQRAKDYYRILGVSENASHDEIKRAFRRLAFEHHPDRNPGHEAEAAERFKEINEAYGVLGDPVKRREYDAWRKASFIGAGHTAGRGGFQYSQEDILRGLFSNPAVMEEVVRMFAQGGLRFDADFLNQTFFSGRAFIINFGPGGFVIDSFVDPSPQGPAGPAPPGKSGLGGKVLAGILKFFLRRLFPDPAAHLPGDNLYQQVTVSPQEAASGCEKRVEYKRGSKHTRLLVKIPAGTTDGMKIRLRGMGMPGNPPGDLYLQVRIR